MSAAAAVCRWLPEIYRFGALPFPERDWGVKNCFLAFLDRPGTGRKLFRPIIIFSSFSSWKYRERGRARCNYTPWCMTSRGALLTLPFFVSLFLKWVPSRPRPKLDHIWPAEKVEVYFAFSSLFFTWPAAEMPVQVLISHLNLTRLVASSRACIYSC